MSSYTKIYKLKLFGAAIYLHWSVMVLSVAVVIIAHDTPIRALLAFSAYLAILFLHELGHACIAVCLDCPPQRVYLTLFHPWSEYATPRSAYQISLIAWGGSIAQLLVALLFIFIMSHPIFLKIPVVGFLLWIMAYVSLALACLHLLPIADLDGKPAWRLLALLAKDGYGKLVQGIYYAITAARKVQRPTVFPHQLNLLQAWNTNHSPLDDHKSDAVISVPMRSSQSNP